MIQGQIQKVLSGFYYVDTGNEILVCRARGKFRRDGLTPLTGDRVTVRKLENSTGYLESILPRENMFVRPAAANLDQLVIIASAAVPRTAPYLIDRMLSVAVLKGCETLLVLNKCDLDPAEQLYDIYTASGIRTIRTSAQSGMGLDMLRDALSGKLSAFTGNTGVGKSSLLNALSPDFALPTGTVSNALGRGRHTTRHVEIYRLANDSRVMDTPGFSSFESDELNLELKEHLPETFPEFAPYTDQCRFTGCTHTRENGCAVLEALRAGKIQASRHESYVRLYEELKSLRAWQKK